MACILIVDDSPTEKFAIYSMLKKHGHNCLFADDGLSGIAIAKEKQPDVILMDVVMPSMNGYQATRCLAKDKTTAHIPVVMVSNKAQESDRIWGLRVGASAYVCKPASENELVSAVNKLVPAV